MKKRKWFETYSERKAFEKEVNRKMAAEYQGKAEVLPTLGKPERQFTKSKNYKLNGPKGMVIKPAKNSVKI